MIYFEQEYGNDCTFIMCGDLNARVGIKPDYAVYENKHILDMLPDDYVMDDAIERNSQDKTVNDYGKILLDFCISTGLRIVNGRCGTDKGIGKFTCVNTQGCSVVDYVLCKSDVLKLFKTFEIYDPNIVSDHCVISFSLNMHTLDNFVDVKNKGDHVKLLYKYKWDDSKKDLYMNVLSSEENTIHFESLCGNILLSNSHEDLDLNVKTFTDILDGVCKPIFKHNLHSNFFNQNHNKDGVYFDHECKNLKNYYYTSLNYYRNNHCDDTRRDMVAARSNYKKCVRNKKYDYDKLQTHKLELARKNNAKLFWKMLKGSVVGNASSLSSDDF
ncbi:uncharacterized protein LOC127876070 [Dreissena polymorpha]|uniref:uncharacterized protein LOC127876070 n=1 Tax=Dreissena polymorpha TaxID=45954 RepID=UPI002263C817|nr:uncharacterized protein LOC127876070 [Dreissena polymorpha]